MGEASIDIQISQYLSMLTSRQKEAVLSVVKSYIDEDDLVNLWDDTTFLEEINKRAADLKNGAVAGISWDEVKQQTRNINPTISGL
jgi:hypothetical protein